MGFGITMCHSASMTACKQCCLMVKLADGKGVEQYRLNGYPSKQTFWEWDTSADCNVQPGC
jgi:hypothetical protein